MTSGQEKVKTDGLTLKLDWLNYTFDLSCRDWVKIELDAMLGESQTLGHGKHHFHSGSFVWASGAVLAWCDTQRRCLLSLNGDTLDLIGQGQVRQVIRFMVADIKARCTRADVALDLHDRRVEVEQVHEAALAGNFLGYRRWRPVEDFKMSKGQRESTGHGIYFGKRGKQGSGKMLRVYDKRLESKGASNAVRFEVQYGGDLAKGRDDQDGFAVEGVGGLLYGEWDNEGNYNRLLGRLVSGAIDFRERDGHKHRERMEVLPWWSALLETLKQGITISISRPIPPLERTLTACVRMFAKSLALARIVMDSAGEDFTAFLQQMVDLGEGKINWNASGEKKLGFNASAVLGRHKPQIAGCQNVGMRHV